MHRHRIVLPKTARWDTEYLKARREEKAKGHKSFAGRPDAPGGRRNNWKKN